MTPDEFREIIDSSLEARARIDIESHYAHHKFIAEFIEKNKVRQQRWEVIQRQVLGWGIIAMVGSIGSIVLKKFGVIF